MKHITFNEACDLKGINKERPIHPSTGTMFTDIGEIWVDGYNTAIDAANIEIGKLEQKIFQLEFEKIKNNL
jgi:hypothetical protein